MDTKSGDAAELRRRAEELAREEAAQVPESVGELSPEETRRTLHELRVHRIELELQNEELRRAQAQLEMSRARYFDLYDLAPVGYFTLGEKGLILEANLAAATLLGTARSALVKKPISHVVFPGDQDIFYRRRKELFETGEPQVFELRMVKIDGTAFLARLEATAAKDADEAPVCLVLMSDITERKQAEEIVRQSEGKLRAVLDSAPFPIVLVDAEDNNVDFWSRGAIDLFGHTASTANEWFQKAYPDPDYRRDVIERWKPFLEKARLSGKPVNTGEYRVTCHDGSVRICELYATFVVNRLVVTFNDITGRKLAQAERERLEAQNRQLQKAESLGRMAGAIAHHFNNQLQAVMGNLELAMDELPPDAGVAGELNDAMQAARKGAEVSGQMLNYLGQTHGSREPVDLSRTCHTGLPFLEAAMSKDIVLVTKFPSPGPTIMANANQVQQVLSNLVTNASESAGEGRHVIHLTVETVPAAAIPTAHRFPVDWQPQGDAYACLKVADTGGGIPEEDIEKIFDPFFSTKLTGRGLGLAVLLGIVRAHGGAVTVETQQGLGSTFRAFFPVSSDEVARPPETASHTANAKAPDIEMQGGGTVLVVDDEPAVRKVTASLLRRLGFAVLEAKDGVEAVEAFREHRDVVRFVLLDLTMPRMDGWLTLAALRKIVPDIPVILASGYDREQVMEDYHPEKPQAFLGKPFQFQDLADAIGQALAPADGPVADDSAAEGSRE